MFNKWGKYSYAEQKSRMTRMRVGILKIAIVIVAYLFLTNVFFPTAVMESGSMQPSIRPGDRFVFFAFNLPRIFPDLFETSVPYEYGNVVMVDMTEKNENNIFINSLNRLARFFTAGKIGFPGKKENVFIKRLIGLPGDEISMINYVIQVHPVGSPYLLTEYEVSNKHYQLNIPHVPALWDESIPFSGNLAPVILDEGECFVLSDDRNTTNDSRTWGPIDIKQIDGVAIFRYWPLNRIGIP
jgi:signal peptidase I